MPRAPCSRKTNGTKHACTYILILIYVLWSARTWLFAALCRGDCATAVLWFAVLTVQRQHAHSYKLLLYCCCCIPVHRFRPLRSLTKKHDWNDRQMNVRCKQATCNAKSFMLQEKKRDAACMCAHTYSPGFILESHKREKKIMVNTQQSKITISYIQSKSSIEWMTVHTIIYNNCNGYIIIRTCLMYHAACKVEFQPFKRSYSQLTFFNFL